MSKKPARKNKRDPWEAFVFGVLFGVILLVAGGYNVVTIAISVASIFLGIMALPSIRLALELRINKPRRLCLPWRRETEAVTCNMIQKNLNSRFYLATRNGFWPPEFTFGRCQP